MNDTSGLIIAIGGRRCTLVELVSVHLLHLDALGLLVGQALLVVFHWKVVVLRVILSRAAIVAL